MKLLIYALLLGSMLISNDALCAKPGSSSCPCTSFDVHNYIHEMTDTTCIEMLYVEKQKDTIKEWVVDAETPAGQPCFRFHLLGPDGAYCELFLASLPGSGCFGLFDYEILTEEQYESCKHAWNDANRQLAFEATMCE